MDNSHPLRTTSAHDRRSNPQPPKHRHGSVTPARSRATRNTVNATSSAKASIAAPSGASTSTVARPASTPGTTRTAVHGRGTPSARKARAAAGRSRHLATADNRNNAASTSAAR